MRWPTGQTPPSEISPLALREDILDDASVHVRQAVVAALIFKRELRVVHSHQAKDGGLQVVDVNGARREAVFRGRKWIAVRVGDVVPVVIGAAVREAGLDAAASEPDGETTRVMVASVVSGGERTL